MKRWTFWAFISITTFAVGIGLVFGVSALIAPISQLRISEVDVKEIVSGPKSVEVDVSRKDQFVPEFRDLPNFEDIDYYLASGKLIYIFDDGIYRTSEVVAKTGQNWLVLTEDGDGYTLRTARASVRQLRSVSWPGNENDAKLAFQVAGKPILALRGVTGLKPGKITTVFHEDENDESEPRISEISDGYKRSFGLGNRIYHLRVSTGLTKDKTKVAVLVLESGNVTQVVKQVPHAISPDRNIIASLIWAGDIDLDGKLDLYLDEFNEKGGTGADFYLSSKARHEKLIELAAAFGAAGC